MSEPVRAAAVVLGAGSGTRVGAEVNKVLLEVAGRPVLAHSVRTALQVPEVVRVVVVVRPGEEQAVQEALAPHLDEDDEVLLVTGGETRSASEQRALRALRGGPEVDVIALHDGARPLASVALWSEAIAVAAEHGGAVPVREVSGLVQRSDAVRVPPLVAVQTPQAFRAEVVLAAYAAAEAEGFEETDTAGCVARYAPQVAVRAIPGPPENVKVTFAADLDLVGDLLWRD